MDKVTNFLERHVQWVAVGLGALWLLLMAWWYVITPPAAVELGGRTLTAGEVDPHTATTVKEQLEVAINEAVVPEMKVTPFAETFLARMSWQNAQPVVLAGGFMNSLGPDIPMPPAPGEGQPGGPGQPALAGTGNTGAGGGPMINPAQGLPSVPQPIPSEARVGRSAIQPVVQQPQPGQPLPPPRPMAQQALQPELEQKDWVTQSFTISIAEIAKAFQAAQIPPQFSRTAFLQVDLIREEQLPDGNWGNEKVIPKLNLGVQNPEFPREKAPRAVEQGYLNWAGTNQATILQPGFFTVVQGEPWLPPGQDMLQNVAFNPATHVGGKGNLTDEQWQQVLQYRREQYKLQQEQKRRAAPRGPRGGEGAPEDMMMEGMFPAPRDADRRAFAQAQRRPQPRRNIPPAVPPEMMGLTPEEMMGMMPEDMMGMEGMGMQPQQPGVRPGVPGVDYPQGEFDPSQWTGNEPIKVFAHDDTVEPGKTYRYRIRYHIKNPLYGTTNVAKMPEHAAKLSLESELSAWAAPVVIPEKVQFFIAGGVLGGRVNFDVFTWEDGVIQNKTFVATPGDPVGRPDTETDYTTGWTLVTLPAQQGDDRIVLVNGDGRLQARTSRADQSDPLYKKLKEAAKLAAEQAGVAAANGTR